MRRIIRNVGIIRNIDAIHLHHIDDAIIDDVQPHGIRIIHAGFRFVIIRRILVVVLRPRHDNMPVQPAHRAAGQSGRRRRKRLRPHCPDQ